MFRTTRKEHEVNSAVWETATRVWLCARDELDRLSQTVEQSAFERVVEMLAGCDGRIITAGVGTSAAAARKIAHSLSCIERPALFLSPGDAVHGALGVVQPGDVAILISKGGDTGEVVALLPALEAKKVPVIAVTERPDSTLGRSAAVTLRIAVEREADEFNMLATTSTMAVIAVFDAVCIALMEVTGYTREQFAVIHPGGAVGRRLTGHADSAP